MENGLTCPQLSFEDLKKINQHEIEYWSARELQTIFRVFAMKIF